MGASSATSTGCLFGQALMAVRGHAGISQSRLGMMAECNLSNLRLIEKGQIQAGVSMALRLLRPLKIDPGIFFDQLAERATILSATSTHACLWPLPLLNNDLFLVNVNNLPIKALFGQYFRYLRIQLKVSQKNVSEAANYHQRNLYNVEQLGQEPGIMTAMTMVAAIAYPVGYFFAQLTERIRELEAIRSADNSTSIKEHYRI